MANRASYNLHVKGRKESVEEFLKAMQWQDKYKNNGVPGVMSCYEDDLVENCTCLCTGYCTGSCKWSIASSMRDKSSNNNIENLSKRLHLEIEAYSNEILACFEEHVYIRYGIVKVDDCVGVCDINMGEAEEPLTDETFDHPILKAAGITKDNYLQYASEHEERCQNGWLHIGGFDKWSFDYVQ